MAGSETDRVNDSVVSVFLSKVGLVLSRVKDTMVADFLEDLKKDNLTWEQFVGDCEKKSISGLNEFIDRIIAKLGFDLSAGSKKIQTTVKALLTSSVKLGNVIQQLVDEESGKDWAKIAEDLLSTKAHDPNAPTDILELSAELFGEQEFKEAVSVSFNGGSASIELAAPGGIGKKLQALIDAVQEVVSIIQQFSSLEWDSIVDDTEKFGDYVNKTYFTKAFGKRILDYILLLLLKHAKEVFREDILAMAESAEELAKRILEELAGSELADFATQLANDIIRYKDEIIAVMQLIDEARKLHDAEAKDTVFVVPQYLATRLEMAKKQMATLVEQAFGSYFSVATVFNRTYAILDFMGVIKTEELPISLDAEKKTKVQVQCLCWGRIEKIFTEPLSYLSSTFAIYDLSDAEKLLVKMLAVARSFNEDIPAYSSIKQMVWELLIRIEHRLEDTVNPLVASMKEDLKKFKDYLVNLLKSMEALVFQIKGEVTTLVDNFVSGGKSALADLSKTINSLTGEAQKAVEAYIKTLTALTGNLPSNEFTDLFIDPLVDAVKEKVPQYLAAYDPELIANQVRQNITKAVSTKEKGNIVDAVKELVNGFSGDVKKVFSTDHWKDVYKEAFVELKKEFENQTRNIPSLQEIKTLSFSDYKNPFSDMDVFAYADIITKHLEGAIPFSPDNYEKKAEAIVNSVLKVNLFQGVVDISAQKVKDDLTALAKDVLISWWSAVLQNIYDRIVKPVVQSIKKGIKDWWVQLLQAVIPTVSKLLEDLFGDMSAEAKMIFGTAGDVAQSAVNLLMLASEAKTVDSWSDGLRFVYRVYSMIPAGIKQALGDLIDLPDLSQLGADISLPDYTLDIENKFFAAAVWSWSDKNADVGGSVSLQVVAYVGEREVDGKKRPGLYFLPIAKGTFDSDINLGKEHHVAVNALATLNGGFDAVSSKADVKEKLDGGKLGLFLYPADSATDIRVLPLASSDSVSAFLSVIFSRGQKNGAVAPLEILSTDVADITLGNYPQKVFIGYDHGFDVGYQGRIENLKVALKLREMNEFFETILKNDIEINLKELMLGYSLRKGFDIDGSFYAVIPIKSDIDLKVVHLNGVNIELGGKNGDLIAKLTTNFTVDLDCITITFPEMGLGCSVNVLGPNGGLGTFDVKPKFQFPNGLGISIDAEAVKGGGILQWEEDEGRFLAALSIEVVELFSANGLLLFTLGSPGKPFSMLAAISMFFNPGIQLGMGFSLTAIGGSLGINRRIDTDKMRDAVLDGSLESVLFVKDLTGDNLTSVLANVSVYFPQANGQFFFGALAQLTWAEIFQVDFGLFLQAPDPLSIIIAGGLHLKVADTMEKLLSLNAYFLGVIDFAKGLSFDAELVDTNLVGLDMYGSLALRILWGGSTKGFLLSAGGFHPQYTPEPGFNVGNMKRIGMKLNYSIIKFSLESYFAVTSNTVQFGADVQLKIGWDKFGLYGYFYFNTLFQFKPFAFLFDIGAGVAVKLGSVTLLSISVDLSLGGPAPWHAKGSGKFTVAFITFKVKFNKTWGKKQQISDIQYLDLLPVFAKSFEEPSNWTVVTTDLIDNLVTVLPYSGTELLMNSCDSLKFDQKDIPLDRKMDKFGEAKPGDIEKLSLSRIGINDPNGSGSAKVNWLKESEYSQTSMSYAPSLVTEMSQEEKLSSPSYVDMNSGFRLQCGERTLNGPVKQSDASKIDWRVEEVDWDKWTANAAKLSTDATPAPAGSAGNVIVISLAPKASQAATAGGGIKEVVVNSDPRKRPSSRRSPAGFDRYIRQMDKASVDRVDRILEQMKEVSNTK